ncbi:hypothetical protein [Actinacidiphila sp. bgisy167]|uniref:hypothetical protein n=1 Tax=Actinacidiphila sp. bgisy167 TaxID=3413797 RepID=UPI003D71216D
MCFEMPSPVGDVLTGTGTLDPADLTAFMAHVQQAAEVYQDVVTHPPQGMTPEQALRALTRIPSHRLTTGLTRDDRDSLIHTAHRSATITPDERRLTAETRTPVAHGSGPAIDENQPNAIQVIAPQPVEEYRTEGDANSDENSVQIPQHEAHSIVMARIRYADAATAFDARLGRYLILRPQSLHAVRQAVLTIGTLFEQRAPHLLPTMGDATPEDARSGDIGTRLEDIAAAATSGNLRELTAMLFNVVTKQALKDFIKLPDNSDFPWLIPERQFRQVAQYPTPRKVRAEGIVPPLSDREKATAGGVDAEGNYVLWHRAVDFISLPFHAPLHKNSEDTGGLVATGSSGSLLLILESLHRLQAVVDGRFNFPEIRLGLIGAFLVGGHHTAHELMRSAAAWPHAERYGFGAYIDGWSRYRHLSPITEAELRRHVAEDGLFPDEIALGIPHVGEASVSTAASGMDILHALGLSPERWAAELERDEQGNLLPAWQPSSPDAPATRLELWSRFMQTSHRLGIALHQEALTKPLGKNSSTSRAFPNAAGHEWELARADVLSVTPEAKSVYKLMKEAGHDPRRLTQRFDRWHREERAGHRRPPAQPNATEPFIGMALTQDASRADMSRRDAQPSIRPNTPASNSAAGRREQPPSPHAFLGTPRGATTPQPADTSTTGPTTTTREGLTGLWQRGEEPVAFLREAVDTAVKQTAARAGIGMDAFTADPNVLNCVSLMEALLEQLHPAEIHAALPGRHAIRPATSADDSAAGSHRAEDRLVPGGTWMPVSTVDQIITALHQAGRGSTALLLEQGRDDIGHALLYAHIGTDPDTGLPHIVRVDPQASHTVEPLNDQARRWIRAGRGTRMTVIDPTGRAADIAALPVQPQSSAPAQTLVDAPTSHHYGMASTTTSPRLDTAEPASTQDRATTPQNPVHDPVQPLRQGPESHRYLLDTSMLPPTGTPEYTEHVKAAAALPTRHATVGDAVGGPVTFADQGRASAVVKQDHAFDTPDPQVLSLSSDDLLSYPRPLGQSGAWGEPEPGSDAARLTGDGKGFGASVEFEGVWDTSAAMRVARDLIVLPDAVERPVAVRAEAARLIGLLLRNDDVRQRVADSGTRVVVIPRTERLANVVEFTGATAADNGIAVFTQEIPPTARGWTDTDRKRVAISEENLLGGDTPENLGRTHPEGYSSALHELAHVVYAFGLTDEQRARVVAAFDTRTAQGPEQQWVDGPLHNMAGLLVGNHSSTNPAEYFAQSVVAYFSANIGRDATTDQHRNNGPDWIKSNDEQLHKLLHHVFGEPTPLLNANALSVTRQEDTQWEALRDHTALAEERSRATQPPSWEALRDHTAPSEERSRTRRPPSIEAVRRTLGKLPERSYQERMHEERYFFGQALDAVRGQSGDWVADEDAPFAGLTPETREDIERNAYSSLLKAREGVADPSETPTNSDFDQSEIRRRFEKRVALAVEKWAALQTGATRYADNPHRLQELADRLERRITTGQPLLQPRPGFTNLPGRVQFGAEIEFGMSGATVDEQRAGAVEVARRLHEAGLTTRPGIDAHHAAYEEGYTSARNGWKIERESFPWQTEVISPILTWGDPLAFRDMDKVLEMLRQSGAHVHDEYMAQDNDALGGHIHVSTSGYDPDGKALRALLTLSDSFEDVLFRLASDYHRGQHRGVNESRPKRLFLDLGPELNAQQLAEAARTKPAISIEHQYGDHRDRVEFRLWDGSLDPAVWRIRVMLSVALVQAGLRHALVDNLAHQLPNEPLGTHAAVSSPGRPVAAPNGEIVTIHQPSPAEARSVLEFVDRLFTRDEDKDEVLTHFLLAPWARDTALVPLPSNAPELAWIKPATALTGYRVRDGVSLMYNNVPLSLFARQALEHQPYFAVTTEARVEGDTSGQAIVPLSDTYAFLDVTPAQFASLLPHLGWQSHQALAVEFYYFGLTDGLMQWVVNLSEILSSPVYLAALPQRLNAQNAQGLSRFELFAARAPQVDTTGVSLPHTLLRHVPRGVDRRALPAPVGLSLMSFDVTELADIPGMVGEYGHRRAVYQRSLADAQAAGRFVELPGVRHLENSSGVDVFREAADSSRAREEEALTALKRFGVQPEAGNSQLLHTVTEQTGTGAELLSARMAEVDEFFVRTVNSRLAELGQNAVSPQRVREALQELSTNHGVAVLKTNRVYRQEAIARHLAGTSRNAVTAGAPFGINEGRGMIGADEHQTEATVDDIRNGDSEIKTESDGPFVDKTMRHATGGDAVGVSVTFADQGRALVDEPIASEVPAATSSTVTGPPATTHSQSRQRATRSDDASSRSSAHTNEQPAAPRAFLDNPRGLTDRPQEVSTTGPTAAPRNSSADPGQRSDKADPGQPNESTSLPRHTRAHSAPPRRYQWTPVVPFREETVPVATGRAGVGLPLEVIRHPASFTAQEITGLDGELAEGLQATADSAALETAVTTATRQAAEAIRRKIAHTPGWGMDNTDILVSVPAEGLVVWMMIAQQLANTLDHRVKISIGNEKEQPIEICPQ